MACLALAFVAASVPASANALDLEVLSNRADLISGGDALVAVTASRGKLELVHRAKGRTREVTRMLAAREGRRHLGLISGLRHGRNVLIARQGGRTARAVITNHPNGGPVFSGPQIQPWECQDDARDAKCNEPADVRLLYLPEGEDQLQPYDAASPPGDVAMTTTDEGITVPFIVRYEIGYQDRDQYKLAALVQPGMRWRPWAAQPQWNHKLVMMHGQGCGVDYRAGSAPSLWGKPTLGVPGVDELSELLLDDVGTFALGRGFAVASTALNNNSHNCNIAVQAESMVMLKEHLIETLGPLRYTIASGCSGGSVTQQQVANAYPGVYQGLTPQCSYPDTFSPGAQFADYHMLRLYFEDPARWGPGIVWSPTQWAAVEGHISHVNAITADEGLFKSAIDPTYPCDGVPDGDRYDPETRPRGVRCDVLSYMINVLGPRPKSARTPLERRTGQRFAGIPFGNVGIQYGLGALRSGHISREQFIDLNVRIGGLSTIALEHSEKRLAGHPSALRNAYRSGALNEANNLDQVAIINLGGPDPGAAHDYSHAWFMRARLEREQGHVGNYAMWFGTIPIAGGPTFRTEALLAVDRWLAAVEADGRDIPLARKIVEDRPADITDRCEHIPAIETPAGLCDIPLAQTRFATPRIIAGDSLASDIGACRLKPLNRTDYYPMNFTDSQWQRLQRAFPSGVCAWGRGGIGQRDTKAWLHYGDQRRHAYGGRPLGPAPRSSGGGWTSPSFGAWRRGR